MSLVSYLANTSFDKGNPRYIVLLTLVAALGELLLFGYDTVKDALLTNSEF